MWSTWGCPRRVRTWPLREGRLRARGVEAQAATASQESEAPAAPLLGKRLGWAGVCLLEMKASASARRAAHGLPVSVPHFPLCSRPLRPRGLLSFLCSTARAAPVSGPPRHLRSCPHPPHGLYPAYTLPIRSGLVLFWSQKTGFGPQMQAPPPFPEGNALRAAGCPAWKRRQSNPHEHDPEDSPGLRAKRRCIRGRTSQ